MQKRWKRPGHSPSFWSWYPTGLQADHRKSAELLHFQPGVRPARSRSAVIYHDAFGLYLRFNPRMAKVFADAGKVIQDGFQQYLQEVTEPRFPEEENWFGMPDRSTMN